MKVYASPGKTVRNYLIAGLVMSTIFYLTFGYPYTWPPLPLHYLVASLPLAIAIVTAIFGIKMNFYEIGKKYLVHHKGNKQLVYHYSDILYIDEAYSDKHKILLFYTRQGHERYLPMDDEQLIYQAVKKHCDRLVSKAEYQIRYPKVKM